MDDSQTPLKKFRKATGAKQAEMAKQLGVTPPQFSRIEREGTTSLPMAMKLSDLTGLPIQSFAKPVAAG